MILSKVYKDAENRLERNEITLGEFERLVDIEVIEPKRGGWKKRTHDTLIAQVNFAYCSECGQPIMHEHTRPLWSFCPNCGADMRGADDDLLQTTQKMVLERGNDL